VRWGGGGTALPAEPGKVFAAAPAPSIAVGGRKAESGCASSLSGLPPPSVSGIIGNLGENCVMTEA
jgi:hypothetical protein